MSEQQLLALADTFARIFASDEELDQRNYRAYEAQRLLGLEHEKIAHFYPNAEALRQRYVDSYNAGARKADDVVCRCGARGYHQCAPCKVAEQREAGR